MRVLYDYQIFQMQKFGGISRVFYEVMNRMKKENYAEIDLSLLFNENYYIRQSSKTFNLKNIPNNLNIKGKTSLLNLINKNYSINKIKKNKYDIFHPTYYDTYFLKYLNNKPFVLTIHDMIHERFDDVAKDDFNTISNKKILISKANSIIAISENTKRDIINTYNVDANKIKVIYWANSLTSEEPIEHPDKYLLYVGQRDGYKNFLNFARAVKGLIQKDPCLHVICSGGGSFNTEEIEVLSNLNILSKFKQTNISDGQLVTLYKNALAFIFPSLYEGFGIPILESFSCGCPAIISNTCCFKEVAQDAALYFNPDSIEDIEEKINRLLNDQELRRSLIYKGKLRNSDFSWSKTVKETYNVYNSLM